MTNSWDNGFFKIIPKMPLTRELEKRNNVEFFKPMRAIFSGSSQSGKTFLIGKMLEKQKELFGGEKYFYLPTPLIFIIVQRREMLYQISGSPLLIFLNHFLYISTW